MKYSIVAADFDDTLLRSDLTVSGYTKEIIRKYEAAGGTFMISTGRMFGSIIKSIRRTGLKGLVISYQGAMISNISDGSAFFHQPMDYEQAAMQIKLLEKETDTIQVYHGDTLYVREKTPGTLNYEKVCEVTAHPLGKTLSEVVLEEKWDVTKILAILPPEKAKKLYAEYSGLYGDRYEFCISKPQYFEVLDKGVSKGNAVKKLCESRGLDSSNVITFGDALNDVSMLEYADLSFCMANGQEEAKKKAKAICPSNDEDGVAKMIEKYCLGGK